MADAIIRVIGAYASTELARDEFKFEKDAAANDYNRQQAEIDSRQEEIKGAAAEQMTDRMREATRKLSMARVLAAQGYGSLDARAKNISAANGEDLARIETNKKKKLSQTQYDRHVSSEQYRERFGAAAAKARGALTRAATGVASAGVSGYADYNSRKTDKNTARNYDDGREDNH
jgi:hypothetical protein